LSQEKWQNCISYLILFTTYLLARLDYDLLFLLLVHLFLAEALSSCRGGRADLLSLSRLIGQLRVEQVLKNCRIRLIALLGQNVRVLTATAACISRSRRDLCVATLLSADRFWWSFHAG